MTNDLSTKNCRARCLQGIAPSAPFRPDPASQAEIRSPTARRAPQTPASPPHAPLTAPPPSTQADRRRSRSPHATDPRLPRDQVAKTATKAPQARPKRPPRRQPNQTASLSRIFSPSIPESSPPIYTAPFVAGLWSGLSRMKGNFHVRFLGEGAAAMPLPYPTQTIPVFWTLAYGVPTAHSVLHFAAPGWS